jgi:FkbM family methyltransferase
VTIRSTFIDGIERVKRNGRPIILYGAAKMAERIHSYLKKHDAPVTHVAVDAQYLPGKPFAGHDVMPIEDILRQYEQANYIVAFGARSGMDHIYEKLTPAAAEIVWCDAGYGTVDEIDQEIAFFGSLASVNKERLENVYAALEDTLSRETLAAYVAQKTTGVFGEYERYYRPDQYFPDELVTLRENEIFVDCGAHHGQSVTAFRGKLARDNIRSCQAIYSFEPAQPNYEKIMASTGDALDWTVIPKGVWSTDTTLSFHLEGAASGVTSGGSVTVEVIALDSFFAEKACTFIKMDVEGAEIQALRGSRQTILRHRPILAVCLYHKPEDILIIPDFIKRLAPDYRLYIRAHDKPATLELVLYAIPPSR